MKHNSNKISILIFQDYLTRMHQNNLLFFLVSLF